jgi:ATP-binding cassette, subfamily B (MDR/TAP), member 1
MVAAGITKARTSANYIFQLRKQVPKDIGESIRPNDKEGPNSGGGVTCQELEFSYPRRPNLKVLNGITTQVKLSQSL